jgi:hypothetical protein
MWRSKKFVIIAVVVVLVLGTVLGSVLVANANDSGTTQTQKDILLDKVAQIYQQNTGTTIDPQELQKAFQQAGQALQDEALDNYLQKLIDDGKITNDQADQFKAWLKDRPTFPTDEFKNWIQSRPDIPGLFGQNGDNPTSLGPNGMMQRGFGMMKRGFGNMFGGWCGPDASPEPTSTATQ